MESVSWNSGGGLEDCWDLGVWRVVCVEPWGVGETTISRHWGPLGWRLAAASGVSLCEPVGVWMVSWVESKGVMDWKAWIGRASKNSWATMKGVLSGSEARVRTQVRRDLANSLPEGTNRIFSVQIIGKSAYLLIL